MRVDTLITRMAVTAAAAATALFALAAPAHADDRSYIGYLKSHGQDVPGYLESDWIGAGHTACGYLGSGETTAQAAQHATWPFRTNGPLVVEAAQHEICPATLGRR